MDSAAMGGVVLQMKIVMAITAYQGWTIMFVLLQTFIKFAREVRAVGIVDKIPLIVDFY